jgi:hypothetical protein
MTVAFAIDSCEECAKIGRELQAMERYRNLSGDSGVAAYEIRRGEIVVAFFNDGKYRYTKASAGASHIANMQRLARAGQGLSTYISQEKPGYAERWD